MKELGLENFSSNDVDWCQVCYMIIFTGFSYRDKGKKKPFDKHTKIENFFSKNVPQPKSTRTFSRAEYHKHFQRNLCIRSKVFIPDGHDDWVTDIPENSRNLPEMFVSRLQPSGFFRAEKWKFLYVKKETLSFCSLPLVPPTSKCLTFPP